VTRKAPDAARVRALFGFGLAFTGLVLERLPSLLLYYYFRFRFSIHEYAQIQEALATAGFLLIGFGLFLLLRELDRRLPASPPYIRYATFAVLIGAVYLVAIGLVNLALLSTLYGGPSATPIPEAVGVLIIVGSWIAQTAMGVGVLLALFGAVRALTPRPAPAVPPPSP